MKVPNFTKATEEGEILEKGGYHQPGTGGIHMPDCGCKLTTSKGAYRDVTVEMDDGMVIHYYHQSPVVVESGDTVRISSCGWKSKSTKERINSHLPSGYRLYQEDFDWYVSCRNGDVRDFRDGMEIKEVKLVVSK